MNKLNVPVEGSMNDDQKSASWIDKRWRPAMAWSYMGICIFDFFAAPILWSILQVSYKGNVTEAWTPLTLQGAGLFHLAMGAILGVTAYSRGQEKMLTMTNQSNYSNYQSSRTQRRQQNQQDYNPSEEDYSPTRDERER